MANFRLERRYIYLIIFCVVGTLVTFYQLFQPLRIDAEVLLGRIDVRNCKVWLRNQTGHTDSGNETGVYTIIPCTNSTPTLLSKEYIPRRDNLLDISKDVVPNIIHYVHFNKGKRKKKLSFLEYMCFLSMEKMQKPSLIYIHGDSLFEGYWWNKVLEDVPNIFHIYTRQPTHLYGKEMHFITHKADVWRLGILLQYGGMFADGDILFIQSWDRFRNYSVTISQEEEGYLNPGAMLSKPNSPFIQRWLEQYKNYDPDCWGCEALIAPWEIKKAHPNWVHVVDNLLVGLPWSQCKNLYVENGFNDWKKCHAIHVFCENNFIVPKSRDEINSMKTPIALMMKHIYDYE